MHKYATYDIWISFNPQSYHHSSAPLTRSVRPKFLNNGWSNEWIKSSMGSIKIISFVLASEYIECRPIYRKVLGFMFIRESIKSFITLGISQQLYGPIYNCKFINALHVLAPFQLRSRRINCLSCGFTIINIST
jgi:hypothetical protein